VIKEVAEPRAVGPSYLAWSNQRNSSMGKAQQWMLKRLEKLTLDELLM
jgi:hypothetical protein